MLSGALHRATALMTTSDDDERSFLGEKALSASAGIRVQRLRYCSSSSLCVVIRAKTGLPAVLGLVLCNR